MGRIKFAVIATFLLSLVAPIQPGIAAPKTGSKCSKAGLTSISKGKVYVCQKKKNQLAWGKGISLGTSNTPKVSPSSSPTASPSESAIPTPSPVPTPIPTSSSIPSTSPAPSATPTPTYTGPVDIFGNPTSEEALKIDKMVDIAWEKGKPATQWIKIRTHERVRGSTWAKDNEAVLPAITRILDGIGAPLTRDVDWFVWWDLPSLQPLLPTYCWARDFNAFRADSVGAGYCIPSTTFIFFEAYQQWYPKEGFLEKYPNEWDKYGIVAVTAGEVVHFSQQLYGERFGHEAFNFYPAWLREGPTIVYSSMAYSKYMNIPYSTVRNLALRHFGHNCKDVKIIDLLMFNQSPSYCEYDSGLLATEYLIAKTGDVAAPFRYLESKMVGNGERCKNPDSICRPSYESVIREIYSKDVDAWHAELDAYVKKWTLNK
jgi:hypothetical protein